MSRIINLRIKNYRCFKDFTAHFEERFIVLIGRGDSGKSSLLKAIEALLSPLWNYSFSDWDFYNGDIEAPIQIEADIADLPEELFDLDSIGFSYKLKRKSGEISTNIEQEEDGDEQIITLRLVVDATLEPKWHVVSGRENVENIELCSKDRDLFNSFLVADTADSQFSYHRTSPLHSIAHCTLTERKEVEQKMLATVRAAFKAGKDASKFDELENGLTEISNNLTKFGLSGDSLKPLLDYKENAYTLRNVAIHQYNRPFRLMGNGSKRLLSMAIQMELTKQGGIVLIDEIEQGLEFDRVTNIVRLFKNASNGQVFVSTHSTHVVCEASCEQFCMISPVHETAYSFNEENISLLRKQPHVFFAKRIICCEGKTELGIVRKLDEQLNLNGNGFSSKGIVAADCGGGTKHYQCAIDLHKKGFDVCVISDNDVLKDDKLKKLHNQALELGITIIRWDDGCSFEGQLFKDLKWENVNELVALANELNEDKDIYASIGFKDVNMLEDPQNDTSELRERIAKKAKGSKNNPAWFKNIEKAEYVGDLLWKCFYNNKIDNNSSLYKQMNKLRQWIAK